jgi:serine/threonine protein kinase/Tol biopolymer transport system component
MNQELWHKAKQIYQSAIELDPQQREAFLAKACAGDDLLRREVESLLSHRPEAEDFMASPALHEAARALAQEQNRDPDPDLSGRSLLHYRVEEKIGAGGMGVVYRAQDTKLDRQVAIKLLPDIFSGDPERLARFEREAKLLASLNHPNIAAIHGLEQAEGKRFLVLEMVDGETLAQRIAKRPLPVEEALEVCRQIAEGLEAAHEKGIIHRDLKPANVKITPEGKVKVLDFGLAKAFHGEAALADAGHPPTLTDQMTRPGVILGTAAYMSPEQAKGKAADKRSDIWSFGCILYECLAGKRAFAGETVTETLAAILKGEPDWGALPVSMPLQVIGLLRRCLQKEPRQRFHDIGDARIMMEMASQEPSAADSTAVSKALKRMRWIAATASTVTLLVLTVAGILWFSQRQLKIKDRITRCQIDVAPARQLGGGGILNRPARTAFALTPDGNSLVFYGLNNEGKTQIFVRSMNRWNPTPIEGTEGALYPFLSPDGSWVAFFADGKIKQVSLSGGHPADICDEPQISFGASWGSGGLIVYALDEALWQVRESGGKSTLLLADNPEKGEYGFRLPHFLPGGEVILFSVRMSPDRWENTHIEAFSLKTGERKTILDEGSDARYISTGHLVFAKRGVLFAVPFDAKQLKLTGEPVQVAEDVMHSMNARGSESQTYAAQFSISESGSLAYVPGGAYSDPMGQLATVDRTGVIQLLSSDEKAYGCPRISPDGRKIVYHTLGRKTDIWVYDLQRNISTPLTFGGINVQPIWHPDGKKVTFVSREKDGRNRVINITVDGSGQSEVLFEHLSPTALSTSSWSADGKTLAYVQWSPGTDNDVGVFHLEGKKTEPVVKTRFDEGWPELSPDGRWLAYATNESGAFEIYIRSLQGKGGEKRISNGCGRRPGPLWRGDGRELYYPGPNNKMMAVDIPDNPDADPGRPRVLFDLGTGVFVGYPVRAYDVDPQGRRFFVAIGREGSLPAGITRINMVLNWFDELQRLCPAGK